MIPATDAVIRRAATRAMVLLKNDGVLLPLPADVHRIALIGPHARYGRVQGGGSARVRPVLRPGPLDALTSRGFDVSFEPGGVIDKFLPTVHGEFTVELAAGGAPRRTSETDRLSWRGDQSPVDGVEPASSTTRITGGFTPDETGAWELGVRAVGPVTVRLEATTVVELTEAQRGGSYYGLGSPEVRGAVELEGGRRYELEVEYPAPRMSPCGGSRSAPAPCPTATTSNGRSRRRPRPRSRSSIVGTDHDWETEGEDRTTMALPGDQDELVAAVAAANPNTIVVVNAGSPVTMPWLDAVPAVLQIWFPGQAIGDALADVLTGVEEPGGRLPVTFPVRLEDTPAFAHHPGRDGRAVYAEGAFIGHRWYDREGIAPLFPFGHGLGYTTFSLGVAAVEGRIDDGVTVSVDVTQHR